MVTEPLPNTRGDGRTWWDVLNSNFMLWVLSGVLVTGLSVAYTRWEEARTEDRVQQETIDRLDMEISHRLRYVADLARTDTIEPARYQVAWYAIAGAREDLRAQSPAGGFFTPVFEQFEGRNIVDLFWQLSLLNDDDQAITKAFNAAGQLLIYYDLIEAYPTESEPEYYSFSESELTDFRTNIWEPLKESRWWTDDDEALPTTTPAETTELPTVVGTTTDATPVQTVVQPAPWEPLVPDYFPSFAAPDFQPEAAEPSQ